MRRQPERAAVGLLVTDLDTALNQQSQLVAWLEQWDARASEQAEEQHRDTMDWTKIAMVVGALAALAAAVIAVLLKK